MSIPDMTDTEEITAPQCKLGLELNNQEPDITQKSSINYTYGNYNRVATVLNTRGTTASYSYDNIGNRITAQENDINLSYNTNPNNQYTQISQNGSNFTPTYDLDGNQTKIESSTGEWLVSYNANNRPISFIQGNTRVECNYDYMGRQYLRKVYKSGSSSPTINDRYIHRGYLRLGALNMNNGADFYQALLWDPTEPQATRPLALFNNDGTYYYGHDFNKNVTELFNANGDIVNHYDYCPYGALLESSESIPNPIQYSSEVYDPELGLISYNYRHYNPQDGRFIIRDFVNDNDYSFCLNNPNISYDLLGLIAIGSGPPETSNCLGGAMTNQGNQSRYPDTSKNEDQNMIDAMKKEQWNCKEVKDVNSCQCKCEDEKILITLYKNTNPNNQDKNPWTDPSFDWNSTYTTLSGNWIKEKPYTDLHAIRALSGCSNKYKNIPQYMPHPQEFNEEIAWVVFENNPLLCCCKSKNPQ